MKRYGFIALLIALAMTLLFVDFYTKAYVYSFLPFNEFGVREIGVFQNLLGVDFAITLAMNKGAAWGVFAEWQQVILGIRIAVIAAMILYLVFISEERSKELPFVLIVTGALGNVLDYFLYGSVVDFLRFNLWGYNFPVFNVADTLITTGVITFFLVSLFSKKKQQCV